MSDVSKTNEALLAKVMDTLAYYQCRANNPKADHPIQGYHAFSEDQRAHLREKQREGAEEIVRMFAATRVPVQGEPNVDREALRDEFRSYLGDEIYVSSRDYSAWAHGTMGMDDFSLAAEDDEIVESLVQIASRATVPDAATAAVGRVRAIHANAGPSQGYDSRFKGGYGMLDDCCAACGSHGEYGVEWPCPTIVALDGAPEPEWEYVGMAFEHGGFMRIRNDQLVPEKFESWRKLVTQYPRVEILRRRKAGPWEVCE